MRNLGKPVELARRYYEEGADEVTFLNITAFRDFPLADQPMLEVLRRTSENVLRAADHRRGHPRLHRWAGPQLLGPGRGLRVFPLRGGQGLHRQRCGGGGASSIWPAATRTASTAIEQIAQVYGNQAVVISIDPRRVYVECPGRDPPPLPLRPRTRARTASACAGIQCTVKGGREGRDLDAVELARACEDLGAGEILLNSIDRDGTGRASTWG